MLPQPTVSALRTALDRSDVSRGLRSWGALSLLALALGALVWLLLTTRAVRSEARTRFFEQYNRQQLLLAEQGARSIEALFRTLRRDLGVVVSLFEGNEVSWERAEAVKGTLTRLFAGLIETPVDDMALFDRNGTVVWSYPPSPGTVGLNLAWRDYFAWARDVGRPGEMYLTPFRPLVAGKAKGEATVMVVQGIYGPDRSFQGLALFALNFDAFARKHVLSVRLGRNGYAWLADSGNRSLLVSPSGAGAGESFEKALLPRWQELYALLLSTADGKPGTGSYDYEDPVDSKGTVRKLVGYAPARVGDHLLVLGVATPEREVEALLSSFMRRQEILSVAVGATIIVCAALLCALLVWWNRALTQQVAVRTKDLEQARAELVAAEKAAAVGHLALGLTHEIRNPLSAIRMNVQMIRDELSHDERLDESFEIVEQEILRLNRLLSDIMGFARPRPLRLTRADLGDEVERVLKLMAPLLGEEGVEVEVRRTGDLGLVCDPEQIHQVVLNLVVNAVEAMKESAGPRRLTVETTEAGGFLLLRMSDTGIGVPAEVQGRVFDPFFTTKAAGGGLGLPTVQAIVLRHGGSVELESGSEGAVLTVRVPAAGPSGGEVAGSPALPGGIGGAPAPARRPADQRRRSA